MKKTLMLFVADVCRIRVQSLGPPRLADGGRVSQSPTRPPQSPPSPPCWLQGRATLPLAAPTCQAFRSTLSSTRASAATRSAPAASLGSLAGLLGCTPERTTRSHSSSSRSRTQTESPARVEGAVTAAALFKTCSDSPVKASKTFSCRLGTEHSKVMRAVCAALCLGRPGFMMQPEITSRELRISSSHVAGCPADC